MQTETYKLGGDLYFKFFDNSIGSIDWKLPEILQKSTENMDSEAVDALAGVMTSVFNLFLQSLIGAIFAVSDLPDSIDRLDHSLRVFCFEQAERLIDLYKNQYGPGQPPKT